MKDIKKYLDEEREGTYGFYFKDLDGNYTYGYNEEVPMTSAGCMKLILAVLVLKKVEAGEFSMEELIAVKEEDKHAGSGILREFIERPYTIRELIAAMVIVGDNTATYKLMSLLGQDQINSMFEDLGLTHTSLSTSPGAADNKTTARDLGRVIELLYAGSYLNKAHSDYILGILRSRGKSKIAFFLPNQLNEQFASKTGDAQGIENEVALINTPTGNFVLSIMASDLPNSVYGQVSLAKAGSMAYYSVMENWDSNGAPQE